MLDSPAAPTPYEVLGVRASVGQADLRRAYRRLLRETHPDTGGSALRFHALQAAWGRVGDPELRAAYDRGQTGESPGERSSFAPPRATPRSGSSLWARTHGVAGDYARKLYVASVQEWAGVDRPIDDPYDPALVRQVPRDIRWLLAKAMAEEATARTVSGLGIAYTIWNDVAAGPSTDKIDHVVLSPTGLFALRSEDWGAEVRLVRGELVGETLAQEEAPVGSLTHDAGSLSRRLRLRFTGLTLVVPDDALAEPVLPVAQGRHAGVTVVRRSVLPHLLGGGMSPTGRTGLTDVSEVRMRLRERIRFV